MVDLNKAKSTLKYIKERQMATANDDKFVSLGQIGLLIFLDKTTDTLTLQAKAFGARGHLSPKCTHRQEKTFPPDALLAVSHALRNGKVFHCNQICSFCQQRADCSVKLSCQKSLIFN